ncbi:MATE family efflux transporter [Vibrio lentus]|uniref:MATE family efflux transporter n=1 Tax=Vibrio lentus TaxID=136468 RepID=UPI000C83B513|nr:MATE family efflux transporter [Vibrio lentus]PMI84782.1 MATE family efflux transporter [Vibrio lentus]
MTTNINPNSSMNNKPESILPRIVKLGLPVALQSALVAILALADVLMVSDFGMESAAAVGIASKWHFVAIMIMAGLASANGTLVAQYWGKNDRKSARTVSSIAMVFGLKVLLPVTAIITLGSQFLMMLQTSDQTVIELGATYLWYGFPVLLLTHIVVVVEASMRSSGDTVTPLLLGGVTIALNIALNFILIKGAFGIPSSPHRPSLWLSYRRIALPLTMNAVLWAMGTMAYQMIFGHMGTTELAVFSMLAPFESLCYSIFFGISVACSVLLGHSLGRDEFDDAMSMGLTFIKAVIGFGAVVGLLLFLGKEHVLSWLNLTNEKLYPLAAPAMMIMCFAVVIRMLNMVIINGIIRAGGDNAFCLRMDFIAMWMVGIPVCVYGAFVAGWDFNYIYGLMLVEEVVKLAICSHRYLSRRWINNLTVTYEEPQAA